MRLAIRWSGVVLGWVIAFGALADARLVTRPEVKQFITMMHKEHGFDTQQLTAVLRDAEFQPKIIESMNKPYEKKPWDTYQQLFVTPQRVSAGVEFWQANQSTLVRAEKQYGVPAHVIVAILGVETLYGKHLGNYRVLDALTTLAFDYPKRAPFFTKELKEYLLLCREQSVNPTTYFGSYAGAIGKPQFMPSSYRFYAVDFSGQGKRDLVHNNQDVIGSVANYFHRHGWKSGAAVVAPAQVKGTRYKQLKANTRQADYSVGHLASMGVQVEPSPAVAQLAGLIALETAKGREFWVAYPNFYVITRYNVSPQYALAVYLLSEQLRQQWRETQGVRKPQQQA